VRRSDLAPRPIGAARRRAATDGAGPRRIPRVDEPMIASRLTFHFNGGLVLSEEGGRFSWLGILTDSALLLTFVTGSTCLVGYSYRRGFLQAFDIPYQLFPMTVPEMLLQGYQLYARMGLPWIFQTGIWIMIVPPIAVVFLSWFRRTTRGRHLLAKLRSVFFNDEVPGRHDKMFLISFIPAAVFLFIFATVLINNQAFLSGNNIGLSIIDDIRSGGRTDFNMPYERAIAVSATVSPEAAKPPTEITGFLVSGSETYLAITDGRTTRVFPKEQVKVLNSEVFPSK
jgi:hypothetical protein